MKVLMTEEFPVLGTGKMDYVTLTHMAEAADASGESWLQRLSHLVRKPKSDKPSTDNPSLADAPCNQNNKHEEETS